MRKIIKEYSKAGNLDYKQVNPNIINDLVNNYNDARIYQIFDNGNKIEVDNITNINTFKQNFEKSGYISGATGNKSFTCDAAKKSCIIINTTTSSSQNTKTDNTTKTDNKTQQQTSGDPSSNFNEKGEFQPQKTIAVAKQIFQGGIPNLSGSVAEDVKRIKKMMNL